MAAKETIRVVTGDNGDKIVVTEELETAVQRWAREGCKQAFKELADRCPVGIEVKHRVRDCERRFWALVAFLAGLGMLNAYQIFAK